MRDGIWYDKPQGIQASSVQVVQFVLIFEKWDYQKAVKFSGNESETRDYLIEPFFNKTSEL